jgi:hypothetical protein
MKISELLIETVFRSDSQWFDEKITQLNSAVKHFDEYVKVYGSHGANIE